MRRLCFWMQFLLAIFAVSTAWATPEQDYLRIYVKLNDSERLERADQFVAALDGFEDCHHQLSDLRENHPGWENVLTTSRMEDCRNKILELEGKLDGPRAAPFPLAVPGEPPPAPGSPVARFVFAHLPPREPSENYPWKDNITTTVFWIDEKTSATSWDPQWVHHNGGADNFRDMNGYASSTHASTLNPFYVALPFNDLANPALAEKWIPGSWLRPSTNGKPVSACKDRWVEVKGRSGRYCFAQWEDVGPTVANDAAYVFGNERPSTERGLNVSPAVAKYLGFTGSAITSWRFVDDADVLPGMWLRYDEQALLFRAMLEAQKK